MLDYWRMAALKLKKVKEEPLLQLNFAIVEGLESFVSCILLLRGCIRHL